MRGRTILLMVLAGIWQTAAVGLAEGGPPSRRAGVDFAREVRPILAGHCFKCHGPDDRARKGKLRLDLGEEAAKAGASGERALVAGKAEESELIRRIFSQEVEEVMPPPGAKLPLSAGDREVLKRWINEGGKYEEHWAFRKAERRAAPAFGRRSWVRNEIDAFVLARLEAEGMVPSAEADRATLLRRVSLDLIGLPPMPDEVEAFVADHDPGAYERVVDRLLTSPRYGERWGRKWLDLARYADTNGYEKDRPRSVWPYRDWVIRAINADMPFDRFTIEQLAGDMLPGAGESQRVATGFHRNTMLNEEGGIDPLEFRYYAMTDRVGTTATVWLGMTLACAQCHTHKYDPIPHKEYYQFMALLDNADEPELRMAGLDTTRRAKLVTAIAQKQTELELRFPAGAEAAGKPDGDRRRAHFLAEYRAWLKREAAAAVTWSLGRPVEVSSNLPRLVVEADGSVFASGDQSKRDLYRLKFKDVPAGTTAVRLEVLPDDRLPNRGPGRVFYEGPFGDFYLSEFRLSREGTAIGLMGASATTPGGKEAVAPAIDGDPQTGWSLNGAEGRENSAVFRLRAPMTTSGELTIELLFERYYAAGLGRFRIWFTSDGRGVEARAIPGDVEAVLLVPAEKRTPAQEEELKQYYLSVAPELAKQREEIEGLRKELSGGPTALVMEERPADNPRGTFVHNRGEFLQATERVTPGVLSVLSERGMAGRVGNRLELARWLVSGTNPVSARVTMNRQWAAFFGRGIVKTVEDFGYQGEAPTHPELLDWLAVRLVDEGWGMKAMHRLIVTSATYRQSSKVTAQMLAGDSENRMLARGARVRLEAEVIRDSLLRASGLLAEKIGGASVFPPQPPGVSTDGAYGNLVWTVSAGGDRYRRGLYTFSKRTAPYAMFTTFDGPTGEVCVARREMSNSPLQALTLLNDPVFTEAARALGGIVARGEGTVEDRVKRLFSRCLGRLPRSEEMRAMVRYYEVQTGRLARGELKAVEIAGDGGDGDVVKRAVWTLLARAILNLDEMVTRG